jgi:glycerophosphoryl diester phosphodiesterase
MQIRLIAVLVFAAASWQAVAQEAYIQAHRGGLDEVPENTLAAMRHAWSIPGAVPEVDLRTTKDGHVICLHDATLARTTDAPEGVRNLDVRELTLEEIQKWDAGGWFDHRYAGETVPVLEAVLQLMNTEPNRQIYLDLKDVELDRLEPLIEKYGIIDRLIFVHGDPAVCADLQERFPGVRTMTWLSGSPRAIKRRFAQLAQQDFRGISQLQFHLPGEATDRGIVYAFDLNYLREAVAITKGAGVSFQVRPFLFDGDSLAQLGHIGIRWYVADAPKAFHEALKSALGGAPTAGQ